MQLPDFKYHPDPIGTGSVVDSSETCVACGQARGYIYAGPVYAEDELQDQLCPWCVADSTAHERFGAEFTDAAMIGGGDKWDEVPESVIAEVAQRTPGFMSWQQEEWFTHCGDAAAFLGSFGHEELGELDPAAVEAIRQDTGLKGAAWTRFYRALDREGSPTAYLFRCLHCGTYGGYTDSD